MVPALLLSFILTQTPPAAAAGAPSDEPTPTADIAAPLKKQEPAPVLRGFDLGLTIFNSTGTYFGAEGYTNTFTFWFEPSFALGARFFKGTWFEKLSIAARVPLEVELS